MSRTWTLDIHGGLQIAEDEFGLPSYTGETGITPELVTDAVTAYIAHHHKVADQAQRWLTKWLMERKGA